MSSVVAPGMDRRQFIKIGAAAGAAVLATIALPSALNGIINRAPRFTPAADLHHEQLSSLTGNTITVANPAGPDSELIVDHVTPATPYVSSDGRPVGDSFSVFFVGPTGVPLKQATHELQHPSLGIFPVFLSPVDLADGANQRYEAVFNRLR